MQYNFGAPCLTWVLYSSETGLQLQNQLVNSYHSAFPEHLQFSDHSATYCSAKLRIEGSLNWNKFRIPAVNSEFGVIGSADHLFTQYAELNLMVFDLQTPEREAEHLIIEYWVPNQWEKLSEILDSLSASLRAQLGTIMESLRPVREGRVSLSSPRLFRALSVTKERSTVNQKLR